jgi:uncharacterized protein (DUF302 family)
VADLFWDGHFPFIDYSTGGSIDGMIRAAEANVARITDKTIVLRGDHATGAAEAGLELRPTELIVLGNVRGGTPLMQAAQTVGIDLSLKMLIWQDSAHKTWLSYNEPSWIAQRHGITESEPAVMKMAAALSAIATKATTAE